MTKIAIDALLTIRDFDTFIRQLECLSNNYQRYQIRSEISAIIVKKIFSKSLKFSRIHFYTQIVKRCLKMITKAACSITNL